LAGRERADTEALVVRGVTLSLWGWSGAVDDLPGG